MAKKPTKPEEKKQPSVRKEPFATDLRVPLKEHEVADRADRAAVLADDIEQKADAAKETAKAARSALARLAAEKRGLEREVRARATYREVQCERRFNYDDGVVSEVRLDTGEEISSRPMTEAEKQLFMSFSPDGQPKPSGGDLDDEFGGDDAA